MVSLLAYAGAGLLQGAGQGMVSQAEQRRQDALEELRHRRELEREARGEARDDKRYERQRGDQIEDRAWTSSENDRVYERSRGDTLEDREAGWGREDFTAERDRGWRQEDVRDERTYESGREDRRERRVDERRAEDRDWRVEDREDTQEFQVGRDDTSWDRRKSERQEDRAWKTEDDARDRTREIRDREDERAYEATKLSETTVTADGRVAIRNPKDGTADYLRDKDGNFIIVGSSKADGTPADVQSARQLAIWKAAAEGREPTAADFVEAFEMVKGGGIKPAERAKLINDRLKAMSEDYNDRRSPEEKRRAAEQEIDALLGGGAPAPAAARPRQGGLIPPDPAPAASGSKDHPLGMMPPKPGTNGVPADIPVGAVIRNKADGSRWKWTGSTYEPAQ